MAGSPISMIDDNQVNALAAREIHQTRYVLGAHIHAVGHRRHARIARGGIKLGELGALRQLPAQGVFATAGSNHQ